MTNNEGGTNDEEFRNAAVVDRTNTTMSVWMGTSFACAQCYSHKYDPITHQEYFKVFAFFNNTQDADRGDESPLHNFQDGSEKVTVPIQRDLDPAKRRTTKVQLRGNYLSLAEEVTEGVPAAFPPLPKGAPMNRLTLARWLVDESNPLTTSSYAKSCTPKLANSPSKWIFCEKSPNKSVCEGTHRVVRRKTSPT
jgi:hypothetical protein